MTTVSIDFKEPIEVSEIQKHYPILPRGLNWNMNENQDVIGIYFSKKNEEILKEEIHNILWFFGEFENDDEDLIVSGIVCKSCKFELPEMLMSEHLDKTNPKNKCLCKHDEEEEDLPTCCGKYCEETKGLKLGMGWYRHHSSVCDMITEQLFCENCFDEFTGHECKGCSEYYPYSQMTYKEGGAFGEALYCYDQFFCKSCVDDIESILYDTDEYK